MNRYRLFSSGILFLFSIYCLVWNPTLPFSLPSWVYLAATIYFAVFPVKDMLPLFSHFLYKGRQFKKCYEPIVDFDHDAFTQMVRKYNKRAVTAMAFWLLFMLTVGLLYWHDIIGKAWIFFFFALSNFCVYFAVFFWCPFYKIFIRPQCCMECRIYNWDSFFSYSFLIFIPSFYTVILFALGVLSLLEWEIMHALHPERFYKISNAKLDCQYCDHESCKQGKKKFFHKELKKEVSL